MKKTLYVPILFSLLLLSNCRCGKKAGNDVNSPENDTVGQVENRDSTLWGRMGDGTTMNVLEFITDEGDTLYLSKMSEETEQEGEMIGSVRNFTDRFAVTTRGEAVDDGASLLTCVNVSQLMGTWKTSDMVLSLYADGTAGNGMANYSGWKVMNGKLVLAGKVNTEYGETDRFDTLQILRLDEDSLLMVTPQHETIAFGR